MVERMDKPTTESLLEKSSSEPVNRTEDRCSVQHTIHQENPTTNRHWKTLLRFRSRWKIIIVIINFCILCVIITLLLWYLKVSPPNAQFISPKQHSGRCEPMRLPLCHKYKISYSYTIIPNYIGHRNQAEATEAINRYDPLISVKCYILLPLFLCSIYAPKCINNGQIVPPCKSLCQETLRKCDFFLGVFTLTWPTTIDCSIFPESSDPEICVGHQEIIKLQRISEACSNGFRCDRMRCLPKSWLCDGYLDCEDMTDEKNCSQCKKGQFHCGKGICIEGSLVCDGQNDCSSGSDERQCFRLNQTTGLENEGRLEVYNTVKKSWFPVCGKDWDSSEMSHKACNILGYQEVNETRLRDESQLIDKRIYSKMAEEEKIQSRTIFSKTKKSCNGDNITVFLKCQNYECGKTVNHIQPTWRIVGGKESIPGSWPWLAALHGGPDEVFFCGGVLISPWWVLSAAHCVGNQTDPNGWTIKLGMTRRTSSPFFVQNRGVSLIVKHPDFRSYNLFNNDLVLLMLDRPVNFDQFLRPICLPPANISLIGQKCVVTGWGKALHDDEADYQVVIHQALVPIVDFETCVNWYAVHDVNISEKMVCAGYGEGKKDACQGDSGGPLLCRHHDHWFVAGIVSWGIKCAQPNLPGIYTNVPLYIEWILITTASYGHPVYIS